MKHCNDYRIIVSSFVLVDLDCRFKILNRSDKRTLWSLMTVSLWFSSSSPLFFFSLFLSLLWLFAFLSLSQSVCVSWVEVRFVFGPTSPQQATDVSCTRLALRFFSFLFFGGGPIVDLLKDIFFSVFRSWQIRGQNWHFFSLFLAQSFSPFFTCISLSSSACLSAFLVFLSHMLR